MNTLIYFLFNGALFLAESTLSSKTRYGGGGGGQDTKHLFLPTLYDYKNIGGGTCPCFAVPENAHKYTVN